MENNDEKPKRYFLSFANPLYYGGLERIMDQAKKTELFDEIYGITDTLLKDNQEFWSRHGKFILNNKRGFGYWLWKPYIVLQTLIRMKENDQLLYCDAGCEINYNDKENLQKYFSILNQPDVNNIGIEMEHIECHYTKMDLFKLLNALEYRNSNQLHATFFFLKKCDKVMKMVEIWYNIASNYHFLNDERSLFRNDFLFVEHRHDQSIFSLLRRKYGSYIINENKEDLSIKCSRNKSKNSVIFVEKSNNSINNIHGFNSQDRINYNLNYKILIKKSSIKMNLKLK